MKSNRKGMGKGRGTGYKNMIRSDPVVHQRAGKGMKTYSTPTERKMMTLAEAKMNPPYTEISDGVYVHLDKEQVKRAKELSRQPTFLESFKDSDGDGVPDKFDCKPHDPKRQDEHTFIERDAKYNETVKQNSVVIGVTEDGAVVSLQIENKVNPWGSDRQENRGFSMSGDEDYPIPLSEAKKRNKEFWIDYFSDEEQIKEMNERMGTSFRSPASATKYVLDTDGELHGFDNSTMSDEIDFKGKTWLFEASSGGQIGLDQKFKKKFIDEKTFNHLKNLWDKYHLKELPSTETIPIFKQDREAVLKEAIKISQQRDKTE